MLLAAHGAQWWGWHFAHARPRAASGTWVFSLRWTVPLLIMKMVMSFHKFVDREVVFAVVESRVPADDLLELDHRINRPHRENVADVARIQARREFCEVVRVVGMVFSLS
jgi:hypothetical protein